MIAPETMAVSVQVHQRTNGDGSGATGAASRASRAITSGKGGRSGVTHPLPGNA